MREKQASLNGPLLVLVIPGADLKGLLTGAFYDCVKHKKTYLFLFDPVITNKRLHKWLEGKL